LTPVPDRDANLDRLLRRFAGPDAPMADPSESVHCLDAETVAAMAEGGLLPHERAAADRHVSTCARCQATLAAVIRTMPEPAPVRAWWRLPALRWLTPVAATGLAVAVWVAVDSRRPPDVAQVSVPLAAPGAAADQKASAASPAPEQRQAIAGTDATRETTAAQPPSPAVRRERAAVDDRDRLAAAKSKDAAPLDKTAAASPAPAEPAAAAPPVASPVLQPVPSLPPQVAQPASSNLAVTAAPVAGGRSGAAGQVRVLADRAGVAGGVVERVGVSTDILSSDPRARWRIAGTGVQRSTDGGTTWTDQATGTAVRLTAGSAPQPDICWVVGDAGTVLVSVDGLAWRRLTPPVQAPFVAVSATSADAATVTTSDGRVFVTANRGQTWQPR
jgi:hypothetical protein